MATLWTTADVMTKERRNREAIMGRVLGLPVYDVDQSVAITLAAKSVDGVALTTSVVTYYTAPSVAEVLTITLCNTDSVARVCTVHLVESGGSADVHSTIFNDTLQPGERVMLGGPWFLNTSDTLRASAAAGAVCSMRADVLEFAGQPSAVTLKVITGATLGNSLATYYTCPSITQAILLAATLCNTDTVVRTPNVHLVKSADSAAVKNRIWSDVLAVKETAIFSGFPILKVGDFIQAKNDVAAVASLRLTVLELT